MADKIDLEALKAPFPETDVEWRVAQAGKTKQGKVWAQVLCYIQARAIQDRLDAVVGAANWKPEYTIVYGKEGVTPGVLCKLSLKIDGEWVGKDDGAEQTDFEPFKGGISGALKRAGSAWGIGRYLYGLEAGFANIVDKGTPGAHYAQTKDKEPFYWTPPALPAWALPAIQRAEKPPVQPQTEPKPKEAPKPETKAPPVKPNDGAKPPAQTKKPGVTVKQRGMLWARLMKLEYSEDEAKEFLKAHSGKEHSADWTRADFEKVLGAIEKIEKNAPPENAGDAWEPPT